MRVTTALVLIFATFALAQDDGTLDPPGVGGNDSTTTTSSSTSTSTSTGSSSSTTSTSSYTPTPSPTSTSRYPRPTPSPTSTSRYPRPTGTVAGDNDNDWYQRYKGGNERWWQHREKNWYAYEHDDYTDEDYYDNNTTGNVQNTNNTRGHHHWYTNTGGATEPSGTTRSINGTTAWNLLKGDVVVIHGFGGSKLVKTSDNSTVWITERILRNLDQPDIKLGLKKDRGEADGIQAGGYMNTETWNPFYGEFLDKLKDLDSKKNITLNLFSYDWRRDNVYTSTLFQAYLTKIYSANGGKPITIFAHSMGGLITMHAYHSFDPASRDMIRGIVFAGSMFNGSPYGITQQLSGGVEGNNTSILNSDSVFLTRSAWSFQCFDDSCMQTTNGRLLRMDLFDADNWIKYRLAAALDPYYNTTIGTYDERVAFTKTQLSYARQIRDAQYPRNSAYYPPMVTVCSRAIDTASRMYVNPNITGLNIDLDNYVMAKGDGVVTWNSCQMQSGMPYQSIESKNDHFRLLNDFDAVGEAIAYIFGY